MIIPILAAWPFTCRIHHYVFIQIEESNRSRLAVYVLIFVQLVFEMRKQNLDEWILCALKRYFRLIQNEEYDIACMAIRVLTSTQN